MRRLPQPVVYGLSFKGSSIFRQFVVNRLAVIRAGPRGFLMGSVFDLLGCEMFPLVGYGFQGLQFVARKQTGIEFTAARNQPVLLEIAPWNINGLNDTGADHFLDHGIGFFRNGAMREFPVFGARYRPPMPLVVVKIHVIEEFHELCSAQMHVVYFLQEEQDNLLQLLPVQ
ncbi:MAG TPA: hypothetical protein PLX89_03350 [Verrucomicrobiota bacterium]|nr:hypothetical protein [Verrucomicrobiota bacterium]